MQPAGANYFYKLIVYKASAKSITLHIHYFECILVKHNKKPLKYKIIIIILIRNTFKDKQDSHKYFLTLPSK